MLLNLSPLEWVKNCELVCRKWNRLINLACLWEITAKKINFLLEVKPNQKINLIFKKHIFTIFNIALPTKTKKEFFDKISKICSLTKETEVIVIKYNSKIDSNSSFNILIANGYKFPIPKEYMWSGFNLIVDPNWPNQLTQINAVKSKIESLVINRTYEILGEGEADFSGEVKPLSENCFFNHFTVSILESSQNLSLEIINIIDFIFNKMEPQNLPSLLFHFAFKRL